MTLKPEWAQKLEQVQSNVFADRRELELIRHQIERGKLTEKEALKRLFDYERRLAFSQTTTENIGLSKADATWGKVELRVFLCHRGSHRETALRLAQSLLPYEIGCFVGEHTIEPTDAWRDAIQHSLRTMHALVALVTDDFHESPWTDQELGFALGRNVPCIGLMAGNSEAKGFLETCPPVRADLRDLPAAATKLARILVRLSGRRDSVVGRLISKILEANSVAQVRERLRLLTDIADRLEDSEVDRFVRAAEGGGPLHPILSRNERLQRLLLKELNGKSQRKLEWRNGNFSVPL